MSTASRAPRAPLRCNERPRVRSWVNNAWSTAASSCPRRAGLGRDSKRRPLSLENVGGQRMCAVPSAQENPTRESTNLLTSVVASDTIWAGRLTLRINITRGSV
jgi:hypothetical protein